MPTFIEYAVKRIIDDAERNKTKGDMVKALSEESDDEIGKRIKSYLEPMAMQYVIKHGEAVVVELETAQEVVSALKKELNTPIPTST
jgi:hypothetical protein